MQPEQLSLPLPTPRCAGWDAAFVAGAPDAVRRDRRRQAVTGFRVLGDRIVEFANVIDDGAPLIDALASYFNVAERSIRQLRRFSAQTLQETDCELEEAVACIEATPSDWIPAEPGWNDFVSVHRKLAELAEATATDYLQLVCATGPDWAGWNRELRWPSVEYLSGPLEAFYRYVFLPEIFGRLRLLSVPITEDMVTRLCSNPPGKVRQELARQLFAGKGPKSILQSIRQWHVGNPNEPSSIPGGEVARRLLCWLPKWDPLCAEATATNGIRLVPLTSAEELIQEGLALNHCIGKYAIRCCYEALHVVSIRTACGFRLATALLSIDRNGLVRLLEHHGESNGESDRRAAEALDWMLGEIADGRLSVDTQSLEAARQRRLARHGGDDAATRRLYMFHCPIARAWMFQALFAPRLGGTYRGMRRDEWLRQTGLKAAASRMVQSLFGEPAARLAAWVR